MNGNAANTEEDFQVPPLREDLKILPAENDAYGRPCWTIHDPVRNRYFRIGYETFELLHRWYLKNGQEIINSVRAQTVLEVETGSLREVIRFLHSNGLLLRDGTGVTAEFTRTAKAGQPPLWKWLVQNYLFVRVPLLHPDRFLRRTQSIADFLASRPVQVLILILGAIGVFLTLRQWDSFVATFMGFANWQGVLWGMVTLTFAKVLHELGHAYCATRYGCRVPSMGVAFLVMYPVLYTDTSDAWRLTRKDWKLRIGAAGVRVELALALIATFLWHLLPPGPVQSAVFLLATTTWITTLLINLSPFLRFDGYYLLSDIVGEVNLQARSFNIAKWAIRTWVLGLDTAMPEPMNAKRRNLLILFAVSVWIYRFFLFIGIAFLVYHLFFKVLGIILFVVEIACFVVMPVFRELRVWWHLRKGARLTAPVILLFGVFIGSGVILAMPWQTTVSVDAYLVASGEAEVVSSLAGQLTHIAVSRGERVKAGQVIAEMTSPDLTAEQRIRDLQLDQAKILLAQSEADPERRGEYSTRLQDVRRLTARVTAIQARQAMLILRAPIDGQMVEFDEDLESGDWIAANSRLAQVVDDRSPMKVVGYVSQRDIASLNGAKHGRFYPELATDPPLEVQIDMIDPFNARNIETVALSTIHGGGIPTHASEHHRYQPLEPVFKVSALVKGDGNEAREMPFGLIWSRRGTLVIEGTPTSFLIRIYHAFVAGVIRESGF